MTFIPVIFQPGIEFLILTVGEDMMADRPATDQPTIDACEAVSNSCVADLSQALIVASSPVNRIVLSRIAQRAYLKANALEPAEATRILSAPTPLSRPGVVIVDIDAQTRATSELFTHLESHRRASPRGLPLVITIVASRHKDTLAESPVDARVVRPVTPEALQPVIDRLVAGVQS